ncbi:MAG: PKD domain-containing protein [Thermoplasmata archaeon]|nr:PKD domain-containing protein [Thermoplasmata archaeon]
MKSDAMSKLSASCIVLVMLLSALVIVPGSSESETTSTKNIYVPVLSGGLPVTTGAWVNLTEVHSGAVIPAQYKSEYTAYVVSGAPSGYYRVDVVANEYYDALSADEFRYDGQSDVTTDVVALQAFTYKEHTWNVTVRNPDNQIVQGALVGFYDPVSKEWVAKGVTNSLGYVSVAMFETAVLGDVDLVIVKSGYETYVEQVLVNSDQTRTVNVAKSKLVSSYVRNGSGPASNVVSYLINTDSSVPWVKRVLKSTGTAMAFDAYAGNFILVVDADGNAAHVQTLTVAGSDVPLTISLGPQTQRENSVAIDFGTDFTSFSMTVDTTWSYDEAYPGLRYSDMGSLRTQVDLLMGDGNGDLTALEAQAFYDAVLAWGTEYVASDRLLTLNETSYISDLAITGFVMDLAAGSVTSTASVNYGYTCGYLASSVPVGGGYYDALAYASYDTSEVNYTYSIDLAPSYEKVSNSSGSYTVSGYTHVTVDPAKATGGPAIVSMKFEASEGPSAGAGVQFSSVSYIVRDDEGNITKYIVRVGANVTFTAEDSADPNGNPMTYTWDFDDGSAPVVTSNETYVYKYTTAALERTVNLTITDSVGMLNWTEITVVCDNADPVPVITVKDKTINMTDFSITVNQTELIVFNGTDSYDYFVDGDTTLGMVDFVQFDYGDNTSSGRISSSNNEQNVTHSYKQAGMFNLTLNVTDVVGHFKNLTLKVHVNDTTKPVIGYTVKNATGGVNLVENATLVFNATDTKDNYDALANLTFHWYFGDGEWDNETGYLVNHTYERFGKLTVSLKVIDTAGNNDTLARVITVNSGPRPKMMVDRVYYEPKNFTEDSSGFILVNMTNKGTSVAKNIVVTFYKVNRDGSQDEITGTYQVLNATTLQPVGSEGVLVGGKVQIKFECTMKNPGTYSIKVVVMSQNQSENTTFVASGTSSMNVEEAAWKEIALWAGVLAVRYVSRRLSKREKKGPRREKRSEGEE